MQIYSTSILVIIERNFPMHDWRSVISRSGKLPAKIVQALDDIGFVVIPGVVKSADLLQLAAAYDSAVSLASSEASSGDMRIGSTSTRVNDFVNRGAEFDSLYIHPLLLEAAYQIICQPFKLSSMHARTLHPNVPAQELHIDFKPGEEKFPLVGFILMVDEFRQENGATRFVPGSHKWSAVPGKLTKNDLTDYESQTRAARGQAGSLIIFNGSVWHGYSANTTDAPRRSIQGAFIPRNEQAATNFLSRMRVETLARISPLARYLLAI